MNFKQIGDGQDYISDCGCFKLAASDDGETYLPMMRQGDQNDLPVVFASVGDEFVTFGQALSIISYY